jgi:hypothetical protein
MNTRALGLGAIPCDIEALKEKKTKAATGPKYPRVKVKLTGKDGNCWAIMGRVNTEMRRHLIGKEERDAFFHEATASAYDPVLQTAMKWVDVEA